MCVKEQAEAFWSSPPGVLKKKKEKTGAVEVQGGREEDRLQLFKYEALWRQAAESSTQHQHIPNYPTITCLTAWIIIGPIIINKLHWEHMQAELKEQLCSPYKPSSITNSPVHLTHVQSVHMSLPYLALARNQQQHDSEWHIALTGPLRIKPHICPPTNATPDAPWSIPLSLGEERVEREKESRRARGELGLKANPKDL